MAGWLAGWLERLCVHCARTTLMYTNTVCHNMVLMKSKVQTTFNYSYGKLRYTRNTCIYMYHKISWRKLKTKNKNCSVWPIRTNMAKNLWCKQFLGVPKCTENMHTHLEYYCSWHEHFRVYPFSLTPNVLCSCMTNRNLFVAVRNKSAQQPIHCLATHLPSTARNTRV